MAEIINFAKAKKNLNKELKLIFDRESENEKLVKKCCKENEIDGQSSGIFTTYQVDEHTKIQKAKGTNSYTIIRSYPIGESLC